MGSQAVRTFTGTPELELAGEDAGEEVQGLVDAGDGFRPDLFEVEVEADAA